MTPLEPTTPFFSVNSTFIEELYDRYLQNPQSVDASWRDYFRSVTNGAASPSQRAASWAAVKSQVIGAQEEGLGIRDSGLGKDKKSTSNQQPATSNESV